MIFILENQTKKYCLRKSLFFFLFDLAFHLIGYMQPHKRQKSHWMNIGTVSFSNPLHKSTPIRMHIAGTFRISLSPILQNILMKSVRMDGRFAGAGHPSYLAFTCTSDSSTLPSSAVLREKRCMPGDLILTVSPGWAGPNLAAWGSG